LPATVPLTTACSIYTVVCPELSVQPENHLAKEDNGSEDEEEGCYEHAELKPGFWSQDGMLGEGLGPALFRRCAKCESHRKPGNETNGDRASERIQRKGTCKSDRISLGIK
jgi:hypothetical protein